MSRELQDILSSGEVIGIKIGGLASGDSVLTQDGVDARIDLRHSLELQASSTAASQLPSAVDTPLQVEFGALQTGTNVSLSAAGAITINTAGTYMLDFVMHYGRTGATGTSILLGRVLVNGTQVNGTFASKVDNASLLIPWKGTLILDLNAADVVTFEIMRDSTGDNSGGLYLVNPTLSGWNDSPSATVYVYKV